MYRSKAYQRQGTRMCMNINNTRGSTTEKKVRTQDWPNVYVCYNKPIHDLAITMMLRLSISLLQTLSFPGRKFQNKHVTVTVTVSHWRACYHFIVLMNSL